ncbi:MAG: hypothetical protein R3183_04335 [Oleiphilaceae bacterium]|nr:hypothetical protein [Oleiphilaceae bacterium]
MKRSDFSRAMLFVLPVLAGITWYGLQPSEQTAEHANASATKQISNAATSSEKTKPAEAMPAGPRTIPGVERGENGHDFNDALKAQLRTIAKAYQEQVQYPDFSVPIEAEALPYKFMPHAPVAVGMPASLSDPTSPELTLLAEKVRYFNGEAPAAIAGIEGLSDNTNSSVTGQLVVDGTIRSYAQVVPSAQHPHQFTLNFDSIQIDDLAWKSEAVIRVEYSFEGKQYARSLPISFVAEVASVAAVGTAQVNEAYLSIPVTVQSQKPGYHRLRANLYDRNSNSPLVHLKAEGELQTGQDTIILKAHIAALQAAGSEGPYELRDLNLQRMPSAPDYITEYGSANDMAYPVDGYPFSVYTQEPYVHEKAQRIAKELLQLGS